jgi:hypothetical protein
VGVIPRVVYTKAPWRLVHVVSLPGFALLSSSATIRNLLALQATCLIETHEQFALISRGRAVSLYYYLFAEPYVLWLWRWKAYLVFPSSLSKVIHSSSLFWLRLVISDKVSTHAVRSSFCSNVAPSKKLLSAITRPGETAGPLHMLSCCMPHPQQESINPVQKLTRLETDAPRALLAHL